MSSIWGNKFEIMRDLSIAQGCVPVDVANTVTADEKPPSREILEETEEEFYRNGVVGSGDFSTPDVDLIKHMLNVVKEHERSPDPDVAEEMYEISKINLSPMEKIKPKVTPKRHKINVAIASLLEKQKVCYENTATKNNCSNLTISKVTDWLECQRDDKIIKERTPNKNDDTSSMFKKKECTSVHEEDSTTPKREEKKLKDRTLNINYDTSSMFKKKTRPSPIEKDSREPIASDKPPTSGYQEYVPSSNAAAYYKKFQECSRIKQMINEDVWARAERQMKEIDERRKIETELFVQSVALTNTPSSPSTQSSSTDDQKLDIVRLPSHRHDLHNFCVVCAVISKSAAGYFSKNWSEENIVDDKETCSDNSNRVIEENIIY